MQKKTLLYLVITLLTVWLLTLTVLFFKNDNQNQVGSITNEYEVSGFSTDFTKIVEENKSSIVTIDADNDISSGFVYKQNNDSVYIICSYHGIADAVNINVIFSNSYLVKAKLLGYDIFTDLAVLEINTPYEIDALKAGNSSLLKAGEFVISIGTFKSIDYESSVKLGMISSPLKTIENIITFNDKIYSYYNDYILVSSLISDGFSGSPFINMNGEVIGMILMNYEEGYNYLLPINEIEILADKIIQDESIDKIHFDFKGIYLKDMPNYEKSNLNINIDLESGLYIEKVKENSFVNLLGIRSGDIITKINNIDLKDVDAYLKIAYSNETTFEFEIIRNNEILIYTGNIND